MVENQKIKTDVHIYNVTGIHNHLIPLSNICNSGVFVNKSSNKLEKGQSIGNKNGLLLKSALLKRIIRVTKALSIETTMSKVLGFQKSVQKKENKNKLNQCNNRKVFRWKCLNLDTIIATQTCSILIIMFLQCSMLVFQTLFQLHKTPLELNLIAKSVYLDYIQHVTAIFLWLSWTVESLEFTS